MALDEPDGGGECWRCGGWGLATDYLSEPEARRMHGETLPLVGFVGATTTSICDCAAGERLRELTEPPGPEDRP